MEIIAGTDPTDRFSLLRCTAIAIVDGAHPAVTWTSESNKTYRLERSDSLAADFASVATNVLAIPPLNTHTDTTAAVSGTLFYRVAVE